MYAPTILAAFVAIATLGGVAQAALQTDGQSVTAFCNGAPALVPIARHACFTINRDIRGAISHAESINGFVDDKGTSFVVVPDQAGSSGGPWTFQTADEDVLITTEGATEGCLKVQVTTYDTTDDARDVIDKIGQFDQCSGKAPVAL